MRKTIAMPVFLGYLITAACILNPILTPTQSGISTATPSRVKSESITVALPTWTPETTFTPTPNPTIPAGLFPIAVGRSYDPGAAILLGGTENGVWIEAADAAARLSGGETYALYAAAGPAGTAAGSKPTKDMLCDQYTLEWNPAPSATSLIGLGGGWNALPRIPEDPPISSFPSYIAAVGDWLAAQGIPVPDPLLAAVKRVDLDGDGTMEAVISASRLSEETGHDVAAGDFSVVLLYRESVPETILLAGDVFPAAESLVFPKAYSLLSILDLNGDGRMEVIVHVSLWEGEGIRVFSFDGSTMDQVFNTSCSL